jgi:hypothetical protein
VLSVRFLFRDSDLLLTNYSVRQYPDDSETKSIPEQDQFRNSRESPTQTALGGKINHRPAHNKTEPMQTRPQQLPLTGQTAWRPSRQSHDVSTRRPGGNVDATLIFVLHSVKTASTSFEREVRLFAFPHGDFRPAATTGFGR